MAEKHIIDTGTGEKLSARLHSADSDRWIFFCHGFGSNKEGSYERRAERAVKEGFNAVRFDFRGNGESDGDFIEQNLSSRMKDLESVIDYFGPDRYVLFGSSFGGKVAFHTAIRRDPEAVIGRSPVTYNDIMSDYREEIEEKGVVEKIEGKKVDERFFEDFDKYSFSETAKKIESPVMIFHGDEDRLVDIENSWVAADELNVDVSVQKFVGEGHSFSDRAEQNMMDLMFCWLRNVL